VQPSSIRPLCGLKRHEKSRLESGQTGSGGVIACASQNWKRFRERPSLDTLGNIMSRLPRQNVIKLSPILAQRKIVFAQCSIFIS
jgi:hypothetical protein